MRHPSASAVALALVLCAAVAVVQPVTAVLCGSYSSSTATSDARGNLCEIVLSPGQYLQVTTCNNVQSGATYSGDTILYLFRNGVQVASHDDISNQPCTHASWLRYSVITGTTYQVRGGCWGAGCSATVQYRVTSSSGCGVAFGTCESCAASGCYWCSASNSCAVSPASCSTSAFVASWGSCPNAAGTSDPPTATPSTPSYSLYSDDTGSGWGTAAGLCALAMLLMIVLGIVYGVRLCTDCQCCGCVPTAADKAAPSVLDRPLGSWHAHSVLAVVVFPLSVLLTFIAIAVDGWDSAKSTPSLLAGAFQFHDGSDRTTYATFCPSNSGTTVTASDRACPPLRIAGAMTFIAVLLALVAAAMALARFWTASPYAAKPLREGGKPAWPLLTVRAIEWYTVLTGTAVLMWLVAGHAALQWYFGHVFGDAQRFQVGPSWALLFIATVIMIPVVYVAHREGNRLVGYSQTGASVAPALGTTQVIAVIHHPAPPLQQQQPMMQAPPGMQQPQPQPMMMQPQPNMPPPQQNGPPPPAYSAPGMPPPYSAQPSMPVGYGAQYAVPPPQPQPMMGQPMMMAGQPMQPNTTTGMGQPVMMAQAPQPMMQPQPVLAPMAPMGVAMPVQEVQMVPQPMPMPMPQPRVPVVPPPGLALPPGAILYSNGDVCDASGNVLGSVPGMQAQAQAHAVPMMAAPMAAPMIAVPVTGQVMVTA